MKKWKNQKDGPIVKMIRIRAVFLEMQISALGGWRMIFTWIKFLKNGIFLEKKDS